MAAHRGEIYLVNLNPAQGREQAGLRPVLVLMIHSDPIEESMPPRSKPQ
jgi:mRNA-degrading endonuclease toxin of MazEF toxin-antitoxin module